MSPLQKLADTRGATLVIVATWLPVLVLFATFVLDVGNWFQHKRHLQTQADAGALAAGGSFNACFGGTGGSATVESMARKYAGDPGTPGAYNPQVGGSNRGSVTVLINSKTYAAGGPGPDDTVEAPPCQAEMVDVKATEANLPLFFGVVPSFFNLRLLPAINAHARIEIRSESSSRGALPVGVPDVNPVSAVATFVDDSTGSALSGCTDSATGVALPTCTVPLARGTTLPSGVVLWDSTGSVATVPIGVQNVGVRIALAGTPLCNAAASPQCGAGISAASGSALCSQVLVTCYDASGATSLVRIRGWSSTPSGAQPNPPQARSVQLTVGSGCSDPYFSSDKAPCPNVGIAAHIDTGTLAASSVLITAFGGSCPNKGCTLTHATGDLWQSGDIAISGAGVVPFTLKWEEQAGTVTGLGACNTKGTNPCKGTFSPDPIVRSYIGTDALSGPIKQLQVWNYDSGAPGTFWADSFQRDATPNTHRLVVKLGMTASLGNAQSVSDAIVALRVIGGSQNQSLDCDPNYSNLSDELANGCRPTYAKNTGTACPNNASALWGTPQPWPCVAIQTGNATNQVPKGLNQRVLGDPKPNTCPAAGQPGHNNWNMFPNFPSGDPRIIQVFLTPFGSFSGSGSTTVPVENFATFYLTGWTGQGSGFNNPCQGKGDDPVPSNDPGTIVGHFIKYVDSLNTGGGGPDLCDFNAFGNCVAVLTK
jgi:Putative Flp pilus-assembly TadE/G-like